MTNILPDHRTILDLEPISLFKIFHIYKYDQFFSLMRRVNYFLNKRKYGNFYSKTSADIYYSYFKFTFVRNPWARVYSWFNNIMVSKDDQTRYKVPNDCSFNHFVKYHINRHPGLRSQLYWLKDSKNNIPLDFVGKFENLDDDFYKICKIIGYESCSLPKTRYTGSQCSYIEAYSNETRDIIWKKYRDDINYFDYSFTTESIK